MAELNRAEVERALERIRAAIQMDGGDVELVGVEGNVVRVRLTGACGACPFSQFTLQMGIEQTLKEQFPELERVEAV
ncbi:MAG: NifU family protein [candidate division KSB1 bacterium]|nr:NifU family protein [candidate division KSB1 bacterium]